MNIGKCDSNCPHSEAIAAGELKHGDDVDRLMNEGVRCRRLLFVVLVVAAKCKVWTIFWFSGPLALIDEKVTITMFRFFFFFSQTTTKTQTFAFQQHRSTRFHCEQTNWHDWIQSRNDEYEPRTKNDERMRRSEVGDDRALSARPAAAEDTERRPSGAIVSFRFVSNRFDSCASLRLSSFISLFLWKKKIFLCLRLLLLRAQITARKGKPLVFCTEGDESTYKALGTCACCVRSTSCRPNDTMVFFFVDWDWRFCRLGVRTMSLPFTHECLQVTKKIPPILRGRNRR